MNFSACKIPDKPGIYCTKKQPPLTCLFPCSFDIVKNPGYLTCRKICIRHKSGSSPYIVSMSFFNYFVYERGCTPALPHYSIIHRFSCLFIPDYSCLPLIGYSYSFDIFTFCPNICHSFYSCSKLR